MKTIKIKVINFDDNNINASGKPLNWFKCQTRLARSSKFLQLSSPAKHLWLWALCECSQSSLRVAYIRPRDISKEIHCRPQSVLSVLSELTGLEWIQVVSDKKDPYIRREENRKEEIREEFKSDSKSDPPPIFKNPEKPKPEKSPIEIHWLAKIWNENVSALPKVSRTDGKRLQKILQRCGERPSAGEWLFIARKVQSSDFLSGRNGKWTACSFDWLLGSNDSGIPNHVRVFEGVYDKNSIAKPNINQGPKPIAYGSAEAVIAEQESRKEILSDDEHAERAANVKAMIKSAIR